MILISNDFRHYRKIYHFEPYNVLLAVATNIAVLLMYINVLESFDEVILNDGMFGVHCGG